MANLAELTARRKLYVDAEAAILRGNQSYAQDGFTFTKADLGEIRRAIKELDAQISAASAGGGFRTWQVRF